MSTAPPMQSRMGFSLIEMLVAMFILVLLVMMSGRLFTNANQSWETGTRKAEVNLIGRSVIDYLSREITKASFSTNAGTPLRVPTLVSGGLRYTTFSESTNPAVMDGLVETVTLRFSGGALTRNDVEVIRNLDDLTFELDPTDPEWPTYVDVSVRFRTSIDRARGLGTNFVDTFAKRIYFPNYHRSRYEDY